jgi:hypothetical protein
MQGMDAQQASCGPSARPGCWPTLIGQHLLMINETCKCLLPGVGDYNPGDALRPPPNPHHLRAGGDKSGSPELDQQCHRETMCVEQGRLSVSGGIAGEKFKGTSSFVHCRYTQVLPVTPRAYF